MLKLNLGSGPEELNLNGYENIDLKSGKNAYPLRYDLESVDEIRASHLLEHFGRREVKAVLKNWVDKLRPGGVLKIAVPSLDKYIEAKAKGIKMASSLDAYIMGGQTDDNDFHKSMFTKPALELLMKEAGLRDIQVWESEVADCASLPISLNLRGQKPGGLETKIQAIMSAPRLGFMANMNAAATIFPSVGAQFTVGTGVFWGQVLSRLFEKHREDGTEYIITCDYDTWYKRNHVVKLLQYMQEHPDIDCIVPLQIKRENEVPMFSLVNEDMQATQMVPVTHFDEELVPIINGHFGLTVFRVSAFSDLEKPWFLAHPNKDGDWGEGRIDEDIHFWHNFHKCGKKVCLATKVNIGHLQLMGVFPGRPRDRFKPVIYYMNQLDRGEYAEHCVPELELKK